MDQRSPSHLPSSSRIAHRGQPYPQTEHRDYYYDDNRHIPESFSRGTFPSPTTATPHASTSVQRPDHRMSRSPEPSRERRRERPAALLASPTVASPHERRSDYYGHSTNRGPEGSYSQAYQNNHNHTASSTSSSSSTHASSSVHPALPPPPSTAASTGRQGKRRATPDFDGDEEQPASGVSTAKTDGGKEKEPGRVLKKARVNVDGTTGHAVSNTAGAPGRTLSCKECRRLKLKCDREFPCSSCRKRGCADICPEGSLTAGRGSRFILANTEELHTTIEELREHIRKLERELPEDHPLIAQIPALPAPRSRNGREADAARREAEKARIREGGVPEDDMRGSDAIPDRLKPFAMYQDSDGLLKDETGEVPQPPLDQKHARPLSSSSSATLTPTASNDLQLEELGLSAVDTAAVNLSKTFPFPWTIDRSLQRRLEEALPSDKDEAKKLCECALYSSAMKWMFTLDTSSSFLPNLLYHCYRNHDTSGDGVEEEVRPRRLASLFMLLAIGSVLETKDREKGMILGEAYHRLARAAVSVTPLMEEPDVDILHTLFLMQWYLLCLSDNRKSVGYAWNLTGFLAKLAQGLGLHRSAKSRMKLIPEDEDKRSLVFWELVNIDCRMALSLGRPPSMCLAHIDIAPPSGDFRRDFHICKNRFLLECLYPIAEHTATMLGLPASANEIHAREQRVLELDQIVENFSFPPVEGEQMTMEKAVGLISRDIARLQLHRQEFITILSRPTPTVPAEPRPHSYSVSTTLRCCASLIGTFANLYDNRAEREMCLKFLGFWFNAFSAGVVLGVYITRSWHCTDRVVQEEVRAARQGLEEAFRLFERAAGGEEGGQGLEFCRKSLPVLLRLRQCTEEQEDASTSKPDANAMQVDAPSTDSKDAVSNSQDGLKRIHDFHTAFGISPSSEMTSPFTASRWPFEPVQSRFDNRDFLDVEHGAMVLEETSFMAWF